MDCLFCKIGKGEIPAEVVYEDDEFISFNDINPQAIVHILVVPKMHYHSLAALKEEDEGMIGRLMMTAKKIAQDQNIDSYRVVFNSGRDAGQEVDHIHLHILGGEKLGPIA